MRKIFNNLLNVVFFIVALVALDKVTDRLDRMGQTTQRLVQQVGYTGPMAGIPSGAPDDIEW
ncbi:hypothetical protein ACTT2I_10495 [Stenotrophomonas sp. PUT21]|uniref:hypothetical protein n=1 Tax=Stenotrophomonas sp. PUT21 TaxID=3456954 RepID=UPI003FCD1668